MKERRIGWKDEVGEVNCCWMTLILIYMLRHKSVNTPLRHKSVNIPSRWRPWHPCHAFRTALPPTTIYCEPGAYDMPFVGWRGVNRLMRHRGVNRLMPYPVFALAPRFKRKLVCPVLSPVPQPIMHIPQVPVEFLNRVIEHISSWRQQNLHLALSYDIPLTVRTFCRFFILMIHSEFPQVTLVWAYLRLQQMN